MLTHSPGTLPWGKHFSVEGDYADGKTFYREAVLNNGGDGTWDYTPSMFWPDGRNLSFLAYAIESTIDYETASGAEGYSSAGTLPTARLSSNHIPFRPTSPGSPDLLVAALLDCPFCCP